MYQKFNLFLAFVFVILTSKLAFSQVTADFNANPVQGCAPLVVNFINNSTGSGTLTYSWAFGNGNTSNLQTPSANYINPGVYSVTLTVSNGTQTNTMVKPNFITVFENPAASFNGDAPLSGCIPLSVSFNDLSTPGDGAITNWQWDFGDGNSSTTQNPSHSFTTVGIYAVSLQVTDEHGCTDDMTIQNYVTASTKPTVAFSANATTNCAVPFAVQFTNTSSGFGSLTYSWDFGDGGVSTGTSPSHTYTVAGTYDVTLIATDQYGCSDTLVMTDYISITPIQAVFHTVPGDSACPGSPVQFFNDSGTSTALWDFGDGMTSSVLNPTHSYSVSGSYVITMVAAPGTPCQSIVHDTIIIRQPPVAMFSPSSHYYCGGPPVTFTDQSPDAVSWNWNLGDGITSTSQNPSASYADEGSYNASVTITDSHGCIGTYTDPTPIIVDFPEANFNWDGDQNHCIPYDVTFTDGSTCNTTYDNIAGYQWDFGDGNTSTSQNPVHTYTTPGEYTMTLTITTATGCTATTSQTIKIGSHQIPIIDYSYTGGCANDSNIHFISMSTDSNLIDFWDWTFIANFPDSNFTVASSSEQHPTVDFDGNDSITIQYIIGYLDCKDTLYDTNAFFLDGPFLQGMDTVFSCENPFHLGLTFAFIKKATRYYWDFDNDGVYDDSTKFNYPAYIYNDTTWHDYPGRGIYWIHLTAFNDSSGCKYEDSLRVRLLDIYAEISAPSPHCINNNLFNISNSLDWDNASAPSANFTINYGDGQTVPYSLYSPFIPHNYPPVTGSYNVILNMQNFLGCTDSDTTFIRIFHPVAGFTFSPDSGCAPLIVTFIDTSHSDTTYTRTWLSGGVGSITDSISLITYNNTGVYYPSLIITDAIGCTSTATPGSAVHIIDLHPSFNVADSTICLGDSVHFSSQAMNAVQYDWNFGDSSPVNNNINPVYLYNDTGLYTVSLIVQSSLPGCRDTIIHNQYISVQSIDAQFTVADVDTNCYPFPVDITNLTSTAYNPAWNWNFGDGGVGIQHTPFHNYTIPGSFLLTLQATTSNGCTDADTIQINITGPYANIQVSPNIICKGDTVTFTLLNASGISTVSWDFGDGGISNDTASVITHVYNTVPPTGGYGPSLIYCSSPNCCLPNSSDSVYVHQVMASFDYTQAVTGDTIYSACQPGAIDFHNTSLGPDSSVWYFDDGQFYSGFEPTTHTYYDTLHTPLTFNIWLTVYNSTVGCVDSISHPFTVYPQPTLELGNNTAICLGNSTQLMAATDASPGTILWTPAQGLSNPISFSPLASPTITTMYSALVSDGQGCTNTDSVNVAVQQVPSLFITVPYPKPAPEFDTTIIIGEFVNIQTYSDQNNVSYAWLPPVGLSCSDCSNPSVQPLQNISYIVVITDSMSCFNVADTVHIKVIEEYSIDVPTAFTPNGDGNNDIVYVRGWGIMKLLEFKIYNRWGECVFSSDDIHYGWNGTFKGITQNIDTYAYTAKGITWGGKTVSKNGLINLLR